MIPPTTYRKLFVRLLLCVSAFILLMSMAWGDASTPPASPSTTVVPDSASSQPSADVTTVIEQATQMTKATKYTEAVEALNAALGNQQMPIDHWALLNTMLNAQYDWAGTLLGHGYAEQALEHYLKCLGIVRELKNKIDEESVLSAIGAVYGDVGQHDKGLDYLHQALTIAREIKDRLGEGAVLGNIGTIYEEASQYDKAFDYDQQALVIAREFKDRNSEEMHVGNIGNVFYFLGQYDKSLDFHQQALVIAREIRNASSEAVQLSSVGIVNTNLGQYDKALISLQQALVIAIKIKDKYCQARTLGNIGIVYEYLYQYDKAIEYDQQALSVYHEIKDRSGECADLSNIGIAYASLGQYGKAIRYYRQALNIAKEIKNRSGEVKTLVAIGSAYENLGQNDKSIDYYMRDLIIAREIKDIDAEGIVLVHLMRFWKRLANPGFVAYYGKEAINTFQSIRHTVHNIDIPARKSFLDGLRETYCGLAEILVEQERFAEAEVVIGMFKDQELLDFVRSDPNVVIQSTPTVSYDDKEQRIVDSEKTVSGQRIVIESEIGELQGLKARTTDQNIRLTYLKSQLEAAENELVKFLIMVSKEPLEVAPAQRPHTEQTVGPLRKAVCILPPGTVAVYTIITSEFLRLVVVTPQGDKAEEYSITDVKLRKLINDWMGELTQTDKQTGLPTGHPNVLGRQLYDILIGPILKDLNEAHATTIMWSLDGELGNAPICALYYGHRYLAERYRNTILGNTDALMAPASDKKLRMLGLGVSKAYPGHDELDGVSKEMHRLVRDSKHPNGLIPGVLLMNKEFKKSTMLAGLNQGYPIVHIASHFDLGPNYAMSNLLLGDGKTISLQDIADWPSGVFKSVDLLVFSACDSAHTGQTPDGRTIETLGALAQDKGATGIMASLWSVNDESTAKLMEAFYAKLSQQKTRDMALALQQAQLALLKGDGKTPAKYAHPYYWAPFILMGNWR